jgi:hypothetical protein
VPGGHDLSLREHLEAFDSMSAAWQFVITEAEKCNNDKLTSAVRVAIKSRALRDSPWAAPPGRSRRAPQSAVLPG